MTPDSHYLTPHENMHFRSHGPGHQQRQNARSHQAHRLPSPRKTSGRHWHWHWWKADCYWHWTSVGTHFSNAPFACRFGRRSLQFALQVSLDRKTKTFLCLCLFLSYPDLCQSVETPARILSPSLFHSIVAWRPDRTNSMLRVRHQLGWSQKSSPQTAWLGSHLHHSQQQEPLGHHLPGVPHEPKTFHVHLHFHHPCDRPCDRRSWHPCDRPCDPERNQNPKVELLMSHFS